MPTPQECPRKLVSTPLPQPDAPSLDEVIARRMRQALGAVPSRLALPIAKTVFGYSHARKMMSTLQRYEGPDAFDAICDYTGIDATVTGLEQLPRQGAALLVTNHPTGAPDGVALWAALRGWREDICFVSSTEAMSFLHGIETFILPVELDASRKTGETEARLGRRLLKAIRQERLIIITPAGCICAQPYGTEPRWTTGYLEMAARFGLPIHIAHIAARNSPSYYLAGRIAKPLQDLLVFRQLINRTGKVVSIRIGAEAYRVTRQCNLDARNHQIRSELFEMAPQP